MAHHSRPLSSRKFGDCTLCCTYLGIDKVDGSGLWKNPWVKCEFSTGRSCMKYTERPQPCRDFHCLWRESNDVPKRFRPDKVKAILTASDERNAIVVHCLERNKPGIVRLKTEFSKYVATLGKVGPVIVTTEKDSTAMGAFASRIEIIK